MTPTNLTSKIELVKIVAGDNDRTQFDPAGLLELAENIRISGLIHPITVRPMNDGTYQIVEGERRFRAVKSLGWDKISARVRPLTDREADDMMLSENVSRRDLDPIDEARAYQKRIEKYGLTEADMAKLAGVSLTRVQFRLKLLKLRPDIQHLVRYGNLQMGYAQILADTALDNNRQTIALRKLGENAKPTPQWFRGICNELLTAQAQEPMFNDLFLTVQTVPDNQKKDETLTIPTPLTHRAPVTGATPLEILQNQITFWTEAAAQWDSAGKTFKKNECLSAIAILNTTIQLF